MLYKAGDTQGKAFLLKWSVFSHQIFRNPKSTKTSPMFLRSSITTCCRAAAMCYTVRVWAVVSGVHVTVGGFSLVEQGIEPNAAVYPELYFAIHQLPIDRPTNCQMVS